MGRRGPKAKQPYDHEYAEVIAECAATGATMAETGRALGISRERVRQIIRKLPGSRAAAP